LSLDSVPVEQRSIYNIISVGDEFRFSPWRFHISAQELARIKVGRAPKHVTIGRVPETVLAAFGAE